jgi:mono/diheme cytochrome c family protein
MRKLKIGMTLGFTIVTAVFFTACSNDGSNTANSSNKMNEPVTPLPAATIDELASGKEVFEKNCVICHQADGSGGKVTIEDKSLNVENLRSNKIKGFSDEKIIGYIMKGVPDEGMPAFKDKLSEGEMRDVVLFIRKEFHNK